MKKIYFKNFKGFQNQIVELRDVNFLVGENSTGKTSFINLISLLSNPEFWFTHQFNTEEVELGYFEEILSKKSTENFFQIGIEKNAEDGEKNITRVLFQFKSDKSIPKIEWIKYSIGELNVHLTPSSKKTNCVYFYKLIPSFQDWIQKFDSHETQKMDIGIPPVRLPIPFLFQIINEAIEKRTNKNMNKLDFNHGILFQRYIWLAPIRAKAKRIYESYDIKFSPEGDHIPSLLKRLFSQTKKKQKIKDILEKFGRESNLFDSIEINEFGGKNISPFEIVIKYGDIPIKLPHVGYGVSQVLPLIIEMLSSNKTMFSIQQPEVHLHPKAQAAFGHFLFKTYQNEGNNFIIETHSDFTINRFRHCLSKTHIEKEIPGQILFFERGLNENKITTIPISNDGSFKAELPDSFRSFFIDEELKLLEL